MSAAAEASPVRVFYFGRAAAPGHHLYAPGSPAGTTPSRLPGFPWNWAHLDAGLLQLAEQADVCDGEVISAHKAGWWAFVWWDRSGDGRAGSNSGLYVSGYGRDERELAFERAKQAFPEIVRRQARPLALQRERPATWKE